MANIDPQPPGNGEQSTRSGPSSPAAGSVAMNGQSTQPGKALIKPASSSIYDQETAPYLPAAQAEASDGNLTSTPVIVVRNLAKTYHLGQTRVRALRGVSLVVEVGADLASRGSMSAPSCWQDGRHLKGIV